MTSFGRIPPGAGRTQTLSRGLYTVGSHSQEQIRPINSAEGTLRANLKANLAQMRKNSKNGGRAQNNTNLNMLVKEMLHVSPTRSVELKSERQNSQPNLSERDRSLDKVDNNPYLSREFMKGEM